MDVIVYDALDTPLLEKSESSIVVPIEGVYAVMEVSSHLDARKLENDAEKIRAVKDMPKVAYPAGAEEFGPTYSLYGRNYVHHPVLGFCFAYDSATLDGLITELGALDDREDPARNVDMICSLTRGCVLNGEAVTHGEERVFTNWRALPSPTSERFAVDVDPDGDQRGIELALFYALMSQELLQARTRPIRMVPYLERWEGEL